MAALNWRESAETALRVSQDLSLAVRERTRRKEVISMVLLVIVVFQLVDLPGALVTHNNMDFLSIVIGLTLCGIALVMNRVGQLTIVALLLIAVVDLGCGMMLFSMPMGLDVTDLPVFDILLISELIAVSLLPPLSVFVVAACNLLFIGIVIMVRPHAPEFAMLLNSNMAYDTLAQPVSLQIVVAVVSYIWVRSALKAIKRADRAEEIAELRRRETEWKQREVEQKQQLEMGIEELSSALINVANGRRMARVQLGEDHMLWRLATSLNFLFVRLGRAAQAEEENKRLRMELARMSEALHAARRANEHALRQEPGQTDPLQQRQAAAVTQSGPFTSGQFWPPMEASQPTIRPQPNSDQLGPQPGRVQPDSDQLDPMRPDSTTHQSFSQRRNGHTLF